MMELDGRVQRHRIARTVYVDSYLALPREGTGSDE
jgi:hypothetical protein